MKMKIVPKRIYEKPSPSDGFRVLVDRLWPRGISKKSARLDLWAKDVAPSSKLRTWFHADPEGRLEKFHKRYQGELKDTKAIGDLRKILRGKSRVTLVTAVKDFEHSHIPVLMKKLR